MKSTPFYRSGHFWAGLALALLVYVTPFLPARVQAVVTPLTGLLAPAVVTSARARTDTSLALKRGENDGGTG